MDDKKCSETQKKWEFKTGDIISCVAIIVSIISISLFYQQQGELIKLREEVEIQKKSTVKIEAYEKLNDAWDLMGGKKGIETITEFSSNYDLTQAKRLIDAALLLLPTSTKAHNTLGTYYYGKNDYKNAIKSFRNALNINPNNVWAHNGLGNTYDDLKQYTEAAKHYQSSLTISGSQPTATFDRQRANTYNGLGRTYFNLKRYSEAINSFEKAIIADPKYAVAHNSLGSIYEYLNCYDDAINYYTNAIKINGDYTKPKYNLERIQQINSKTSKKCKSGV